MMRAIARLLRFGRDRRGVSAVEFALLAPVMIAFYFGCVEISDGVAVDRKVSLTAAALANLVAQSTSLSYNDMTNVLDASTAIIAAVFGEQSEDDGVVPEHRRQQERHHKWSRSGTTGAVRRAHACRPI